MAERRVSDQLLAAAREIDAGRVQFFLESREWLPGADAALRTLLTLLSNGIWHEETNRVPVVSESIRRAAADLAAEINRDVA